MGRRLEVCEFAAALSISSEVARYGENKSFYISHKYNSALMYLVPRYVYVGKCTRAASPKKQGTEGLLTKLLQKNKRCTWSQDTYMSVLMYQGYIPPQKNNRRPIDEIAKKNKIKNNLNTELDEMGVFSAVAGNQFPNQLQKRVLPALFHLRCPSQSHQRSARGRTRLTTVTSISCRSF